MAAIKMPPPSAVPSENGQSPLPGGANLPS